MLQRLPMKIVLPVAVVLISLLSFKLMMDNPPQVPQREVPANYPAVEYVVAQPKTVNLSVYSQGRIAPHTETVVKTQVNGEVKWMSPLLVHGGVFKAGEALLKLDTTDYEAELANSKTALLRAETELNHAQREHKRMRSLKAKSLASDTQLDNAARALKLAEAQMNEARVRNRAAQKNMERTTITAPFTGRVRSEHVDIGQFITRGEQVAVLYATDYYEVRLPIDIEKFTYLSMRSNDRGVLPNEQRPFVTLTSKDGVNEYQWLGVLQRTEGELDAETRLLHGVVQVENLADSDQMPLLLGLFVHAEIEGRTVDNVVQLPRAALRDNSQVLVIDEESRLRYRKVDVLRVQGETVLVQAGLEAGEKVCSSPLLIVVDGMRVQASADERA